MKVVFKNTSLVFQKTQEPYCGIFNPSSTHVNTIFKDGCGGENTLIASPGTNIMCKGYTRQMVNATKLMYVDVFEIPDIEFPSSGSGDYYSAPFCVVRNLGTAAHQTLGLWMKNEHLAIEHVVWLGTATANNNFVAASTDLKVSNMNYNTGGTYTATGDTIAGATTALTVKVTPETIDGENWLFFEIHIDADQDFESSLAIMINKADGGSAQNVGNKIITANWTHINDNVALDAMTYYPAVGHNPQKDPTAQ